MATTIKSRAMQNIKLRKPVAEDGAAVWELIRNCRPLDENSMYCNMLQCDHFRDTCVIAESGGRVVGWISGYLVPGDDSALFVWQVAVSDHARGAGLAGRMLQAILSRDICANVDIFERRESAVRSYCRSFDTVFTRASGSTLTDTQGRDYIDFLAGCSSLNYGHNDPDMKAALIEHITGDGIAHALDMYTDQGRRSWRRSSA
jgi:L-2,4-diaminobutyric acid acetyltransferase